MFSFIRLIDQTIIAGMLVCETDYDVTLENAVMLGSNFQRGNIEASYFFKGMYNPFATEEPNVTIMEKRNIVSFHNNLASDLESQYNKFIEDCFEAKNSFSKLTNEQVEKMLDETTEMLDAMHESANTVLH